MCEQQERCITEFMSNFRLPTVIELSNSISSNRVLFRLSKYSVLIIRQQTAVSDLDVVQLN
jgi:hypothetical protein